MLKNINVNIMLAVVGIFAVTVFLFMLQSHSVPVDQVSEEVTVEENGNEASKSENGNHDETETNTNDNGSEENESNGSDIEEANENTNGQEYLWGLDSADRVDQSFYDCFVTNFGEPVAFGRYLETKDGVSYGLSEEEVAFLQDKGIKIIPIYNHFIDGTTYEKGVQEAETAITYAEAIGVTEGVYIFANVEPEYPIDADFLLGWFETIQSSQYKPGVYGIFGEGRELTAAFERALGNNEAIGEEMAVWHSSEPYIGITTKENKPEFAPDVPDFVNVSIWQYGIDAETCNIDTNLINSEIMDSLW
ncbi:glycoside hydrolase domain-containing protein [Anaerobacillus alkaliphilus]|uniref:glycoside hydrolase domain-containing protein n=1 Tax=Anaerobacillus alkaliphilus TaxID=1548597 RepID=UPI001375DA3C|nr:glycoside hydrolase domain-containing protein [Anaerobacillus alkaliphilus]